MKGIAGGFSAVALATAILFGAQARAECSGEESCTLDDHSGKMKPEHHADNGHHTDHQDHMTDDWNPEDPSEELFGFEGGFWPGESCFAVAAEQVNVAVEGGVYYDDVHYGDVYQSYSSQGHKARHHRRHRPPRYLPSFEELDQNQDGMLSAQEYLQYQSRTSHPVAIPPGDFIILPGGPPPPDDAAQPGGP